VDVHPEMLLQVVLTADARSVVLEVQVQKELVYLDPNLLTNQRFQLGLGLYLARRIFEMHDGEFEVIVQSGMTRYTAKLPLRVPSRVAEESLVDHAR
ncbi:MAG: ATP-binding protein, partial [Pseudomonadales bacterium]